MNGAQATSRPRAEILLVEDNPADARLVEEALKESRYPYHLNVAKDGMEALQVLRREDGFASSPRPNIILLDLNLPRKDGREVLQEIKQDPELCNIPVVILTTSKAQDDVNTAYLLHANCYVIKPNRATDFFDLIEKVHEFWFNVVQLPAVYPDRSSVQSR